MGPERATRVIFEEFWNQQDFDHAPDVLAESFQLHIGGVSHTTDINEFKTIVGAWHAAFDNFHFAVHAIVTSDDLSAVHATLHGVHSGVWRDLAPTGKSVEVEHMFFLRFEADRVVDVWELHDRSELRRQLKRE